MTEEIDSDTFGLTRRKILAVSQVVIGLITPLEYLTIALGASIDEISFFQGAYLLGFPALCYFFLAYVAISQRVSQVAVLESGVWGAAIMGLISFVIPAIFVWFSTGSHYHGGGANIGVALIVAAQPLYLPIVMYLGFRVGKGLYVWRA